MSNSLPPRPTADVLRARVEEAFPALVDELAELVAIPSVSSDPAHAEDVVASARHIRDRFAGLGRLVVCGQRSIFVDLSARQ